MGRRRVRDLGGLRGGGKVGLKREETRGPREPLRSLTVRDHCVTAPGPVGNETAEAGNYRVLGDVVGRLAQRARGADTARSIAVLEEMADAPVSLVEPLRVEPLKTVHSEAERRLRGPDQQVDVIGHQAIREAVPLPAPNDVPEQI